MSDPTSFLALYDGMDAALQPANFPATSPWWRKEIERFLRAGRRRWVIRAGRRAGKSSTLARLAVAWALWGSWSVPAGDIAVIPFVSVDRDEAASRLRTIAAILRALGIAFEERTDEIEITGARRVLFRVTTCSTRGTVGFTSIAIFSDEVARWESRETGANPAKEVIGSLAPTMATQPAAFMVLSSSPWSIDDYHAEQFDLGDTEHQLTSFAETWTANPTLTEEATHGLEPHEPTWSREYAAIAADVVTANWFGDYAIEQAIQKGKRELPYTTGLRVHVALDLSTSRNSDDRIGWAVASSRAGIWDDAASARGPRLTTLHDCGSWPVDRSPREIARRLRDEVCQRFNTRQILVDQYSDQAFAQLCGDVGLKVQIIPWRPGEAAVDVSRERESDRQLTKADRYRSVRTAMASGDLIMPDNAELIADMRACRSVLLPSGSERIEVKRSKRGHGDCLSASIMCLSQALISNARIPENELLAHERFNRDHRVEILMGYEQPRTPQDSADVGVYCGSVIRRLGG